MKKIFLAILLIVSTSLVVSPEIKQAATYDYCTSSGSSVAGSGSNKVFVQNGNKSYGACHIAYYHMHKVGAGSVKVDGVSKSQFRRQLTRYQMAEVAAGILSSGKITVVSQSEGGYKAEGFNASLNQHIRVVYYHDIINGIQYGQVITMYPYK